MITVRLPDDLEAEIRTISDLENRSKTSIIKDALTEYVRHYRGQQSSYDLGKDLFGAAASSAGNLSVTYKRRLQQALDEKHSGGRRSPDRPV